MTNNDRPVEQDATMPPQDNAAPQAGEGQAQAADPLAQANERIAALEAELAKLKDQTLRALADAENVRRRAQREIEENNKFAVSAFARDVLPVVDNLRRALDSLPAEARASDERLDKFAAGIELTEREFLAILERFGVQRIDPLGQPFDHNFHQAVMQVDSDQPAGTVAQVLQPGFTIHGRLLRPAMVAVSKGSAASPLGARVDTTA